jgi:sigma-B regulation protein RsbU (phosphoserine phosphatase)
VVATNLGSIGLFRLPPYIEPLGFAAFLASLGRVVLQRAVESSRRLVVLDRELQIARRMQQAILPRRVPSTERLRIAARYEPMRAVGGDFYDFLEIDDQHVGILIADVSGHGVPAALIASMVKVAVAAQREHASEPACVLHGMNEALSGTMKGQFVTAGYLYLDLAAGKLRYASAGHPPLLRRRGPGVDAIHRNGLALGLSNRARYESEERDLQDRDWFLLYTDGLLEAHNERMEQFGTDGVRGVLARPDGFVSPEDALARIWEGTGGWAGYDRGRLQEDDLTAVAIEVRSS